MTSCISIWVKNLANVANATGWVRREGATLGGRGRSLHTVLLDWSVYFSVSLVFLSFV